MFVIGTPDDSYDNNVVVASTSSTASLQDEEYTFGEWVVWQLLKK